MGGEGQLRAYLDATPTRFRMWMTGTAPLPWNDFLKVVDLLSEHYDEQIRQSRNDMRKHLATQSRQQIDRAKALRARSLEAIESSRRTFARASEVQRMSVNLREVARPLPEHLQHPALRQPLFSKDFAPRDREELANAALEAAMAVARTDLGDLQIVESAGVSVAAQRGFPAELALSLASLERDFPCDRQWQLHDLREASTFKSPAGQAIIEAGSRALVCTPLKDEMGLVLGSINAHFRTPGDADSAMLALLTLVSRRTATWLDARPEA